MKLLKVIALICVLPSLALAGGGGDNTYIETANINLNDTASLQRGAQLFMNNCVGCHSMKYLRFERLSEDLSIPEELLKENLMFSATKLGQTVKTSLPEADAKVWFGAAPPDLTLETRVRGPDWVYSYLINFYSDETRPFGYDNHVFPKVGMPHVLARLEASQGKDAFEVSMLDLTNFMTYATEPTRLERESLGVKVLVFLFLLLIPAWFLNKEYWKDIH